MGKITDIKPQARNKGRVSLFIDGRFFCGLEKLTAAEKKLKIGDEIDPERLREAIAESEAASAFERAAGYLGVRPRSEKEMRTYLGGKGYGDETVNATVEKLKSYGYIDDEDFCRVYIESYAEKLGVRKIEAELLNKGVPRETVDNALESLEGQQDAAVRLAEKYLRSHAPDRRKLTAYLMGKGFEYDVARSAAEEAIDGDEI